MNDNDWGCWYIEEVFIYFGILLVYFFFLLGSGGIGQGYFLLEVIDLVDEEGDLVGDKVLRC